MNQLDLDAIDSAVASVASKLTPEDRFDLRQELAIKLLLLSPAEHDDLKSVTAWARTTARNWMLNLVRDANEHRKLLKELHAGMKSGPGRKGLNWQPTWYAPHEHAQEFAPFACTGARVMHAKSAAPSTRNTVEDALIAAIDS